MTQFTWPSTPPKQANRAARSRPPRVEAEPTTWAWHYRLHERLANERLVCVLIGFDPSYGRERAKADVKKALNRIGVLSYTLWELIGEYDVMLEAWLPVNIDVTALREAIDEEVLNSNVDMLTMTVDRVLHHWMWAEEPDFAQAKNIVESRHFRTLNGPSERSIPPAQLRRYRAAGLVERVPRYNTIKFFMRISNPRRGTNQETHVGLAELAREGLQDAEILCPVVMRVSGDGGLYLLSGRVPPAQFEQISVALGKSLSQHGLLESLRCRTTTHISAFHGPIDRREQLLPEEIEVEGDGHLTPLMVRSWLLRPEGAELEFKSSAFTDVDKAVGRSLSRPRRTKDQAAAEIAKAVCGMLNASGGYVVIGVAELDRYTLEELTAAYGHVPVEGDRAVLGVNKEYPDKSGWDNYERQLADKVGKHLSGGAASWLKFHPVEVEDRMVCAIEVGRPSRWFFLKEKVGDRNSRVIEVFYGRTGGQTRPLQGQEMMEFQEAHARTSRGDRE